jgi:hypothetical protein
VMALINTTRRRHPHSTCSMRMSASLELLLAHLLSISTSEHRYVHLQRHGHPPIAIALPNGPTHAPMRKNSVPPPPAAAAARKRDMYLRQRNQQRQSRSQHAGPVSTHGIHRPRPVAAQRGGGGG